ncbi:MAG: MATE family efflux transporter [Selenomonadaceae bacterium]|nr:MATE family efflux transporter [Selenomonadaceae bacterium]
MFKAREIDMLHGKLWDKIILFALPLALTGVMQQLLNAADVAVLGQFVGKNAMAAVGNNTALIGLLVNLFMGLSLGANVVIAQNIGAEKFDRVHDAVHTAFLLALIVGVALCGIAEALVNPVFEWLAVPAAVAPMAETYLRIYAFGLPVMGIYNFEAAIFRSRGDTQTPLIALTIASFLNIALNLIFVLQFGMGVDGVAWATVIANAVSAVILFRGLLKAEGVIQLNLREMRLDKACLKETVRIGLPAGVQGMVFSLSNLLIQAAINSLGPDAMAASAAAFTVEINVFCLTNGFGQAATTFVSQNYGAGNLARCKAVTKVSLQINTVLMFILSAAILYFAEPLVGFFNEDPEVIRLGVIRLWYIIAPEIISVVMEIISGSLRGYGISLAPAIITLVFVCGIRITWVFTVFAKIPTYASLMAVYGVSWFFTMIFLLVAYRFYTKHLKVIKL